MNIDYLDLVLSTCFTLRKVKVISIQEEKRVFNMRPQLHVMIISPFGTFKSSMTKIFKHYFEDYIYPVDTFTRAGIEGTISKDGDYIPPLLIKLGGKVMIVDEWNSLDCIAQESLLGILENQATSRNLGFKLKAPFKYKGKFGFVRMEENRIYGEMLFSCIAYAMEYPIYTQKDKALLSRFTPLFVQPNLEYMKAHTSGNFNVNVDDASYDVETVVISKEAYMDFHDKYYTYVIENKLIPFNTDDYGYLSRAMSDIIRFGVYNYMSKNKPTSKTILIDDASYFTLYFDNIHTLLHQFSNPKTKGKLAQYKALVEKTPGKSAKFYADTLGVSRTAIYDFDKEISGKGFKEAEVNEEEQEEGIPEL